ncbi:unnamed protein product [Symbiodinium necroappetens]|uniref:Uncharacterized protein n=1 Tax=Symbiodinium necroappetens TaxID=1628268 RepID=A0A813AZW9_9DINO|nr:unnamed protein product [Symbiodinium necroappetens]
MDADNICFNEAKEATDQMVLRELQEHVAVGTKPQGHFLDILHDVPKEDIDTGMLKGIFKDKAWGDVPYARKINGHPNFDYESQFFILTQSNDKLTIVKHFFLTKDMEKRLCELRRVFVEKEKKKIVFGDGKNWKDVEADTWDNIGTYLRVIIDEATFDKRDISNELDFKLLMRNKNISIMWEQGLGVFKEDIHRAIRRIEWKQIGTKLLKESFMIDDRVVHCRIRVKKNGKYTWMQPKYVSIVKHTLPKSKKILFVKSGTQVIDRCWRVLKDRIHINQHSKAGSHLLRAKLRAAQYEYWYRNTDLWIKCGELCADHMKQLT